MLFIKNTLTVEPLLIMKYFYIVEYKKCKYLMFFQLMVLAVITDVLAPPSYCC